MRIKSGRGAAAAVVAVALMLTLALAASAQAANGTWKRAWGDNVNGGGVFGVCTAAPSCLQGSGGGLGGDVLQPQGVATDSSGNVYVADEDNNRIDKFDSSGNFLRAWGKNVNGGGVFGICTMASSCQAGTSGGLGGEMFNPVGVAIAGGDVYVSDLDRIQEFDSSGNWQRAWGKDVVQAGHTGDTGFGFEICTVATDCKSGATGGTGGAMFNPAGLATDSVGNVYLADEHNSRIQEFNSSGAFLRTWGKDVIQDGQTGDTGTGFEICTVATDCQAGDPDGGGLGGEFASPSGVAIDSSDNVYVADQVNNRIQKFSPPPSLSFQRSWGKGVNGGTAFGICTVAASCQAGTTGGFGGEMNFPAYLAITGATVYVSDEFNNRIQEFDTSGNWQRAWGKNVNQGGGIFGVCTAASGCCPGTAGHLGGELSDPVGVATDAAGDLYVAEGNRMQEFADSGSTAGGAGPGCTPPTGGGGSGVGAGTAPSPTPSSTSCKKKKKKKHKKRAASAKKKKKGCKKRKKGKKH